MKKCIFVLTMLTSFQLLATKTGSISGHVTDKETGEKIVGANIIIDGTMLGASTDISGFYQIQNIFYDAHFNIGSILFLIGKINKAIKVFFSARKILAKIDDKQKLFELLNLISLCYE